VSELRENLKFGQVEVEDTHAEAFSAWATRVLVTAATARWARTAAVEATGYGTSVIGCDAEAGVEREWSALETPDGRPGVSVLFFAFHRDALQAAVRNRVGQCVLTCPTTACYNALPAAPDASIDVGGWLRFFGDGFQRVAEENGRRLWHIPVMDGEFVCEERFGTVRGVAGGNLLICGVDQQAALTAAEAAVSAIEPLPNVVTPFPGGVVRSGSKVGSRRYAKLKASTNDAFCPTLRAVTDSALPPDVGAVYEIVVDGLDAEAVAKALRAGLHAAARCPGVVRITAGNYDGRLGRHRFYLRDLL